jgi:hypothetical protein
MTDRFVQQDSVLSREVESALLLLAPGADGVISLSGAGPTIWSLLREPRTVDDLVARLARRFDVEPRNIEADVHCTIDLLLAAHVIRADAA